MYKKIFHCISWWEKSDVGCRMFGVWFWMLDVRGWMSEVGCWEITKTSGIVLQASGIKMGFRSQRLEVGRPKTGVKKTSDTGLCTSGIKMRSEVRGWKLEDRRKEFKKTSDIWLRALKVRIWIANICYRNTLLVAGLFFC